MAKRSDIEKQIADLQSQLESADTDDEVWIRDGDHEIKVSGKRATAILGRYSKLWESADEGDEDEGDEGDGEEEKDDAPGGGAGSYFKRRRG